MSDQARSRDEGIAAEVTWLSKDIRHFRAGLELQVFGAPAGKKLEKKIAPLKSRIWAISMSISGSESCLEEPIVQQQLITPPAFHCSICRDGAGDKKRFSDLSRQFNLFLYCHEIAVE